MIKVLFADDDLLSLNRIRDIIDWNGNGFDIVGQATDGEETIELVKKLRPDILILDINMPVIMGTEVSKTIKEQFADIVILIMSNYDDFEYVRQTMRNGAEDYLLKHRLTSQTLLKKLDELKSRIEEQRSKTDVDKYFSAVAKQEILRRLLLGNVTDNEYDDVIKNQSPLKSNVIVCMQIINFMILTNRSTENSRNAMIQSVLGIASNLFLTINNGIITHISNGRFVILFDFTSMASKKSIYEQTQMHMQLISGKINKLLGIKVIYEYTDFGGVEVINKAYGAVTAMLEHTPINEPQTELIGIADEKEIINSIYAGDLSKTKLTLANIFDRSAVKNASKMSIEQLVCRLLNIGLRFAENNPITANYEKIIQPAFINELGNNEIYDILLDYFTSIIDGVIKSKYESCSEYIKMAIKYINANYSKDISLSVVSEAVGISDAYLSKLFKNELCMSFVDYLTQYRINSAKTFIENGKSLKEVYQNVGFRNYNYFIKVFTEKTGVTPAKYLSVDTNGVKVGV